MAGLHALLSPSKAHRDSRCVAALAACRDIVDKPSQYAAEGTAYHEIAAKVLELGADWQCANYVGEVITADGFSFTIDEDNAAYAQRYVDAVRRLPGRQFYEVKLDTSEVIGVPGQSGTGDAVTLDYQHLTIHVDDLKFGRGEVVYACGNEQLMIYGAAALRRYEIMADWKFVRLGIHQPRVNHYSEHTYTVEELEAEIARIRPNLQKAYALYQNPPADLTPFMTPTEKGCRWCPIRGSCAARTKQVVDMFPVVSQAKPVQMSDADLAAARDKVDQIEQWCSDIKEEAHKRAVFEGRTLPGWKVVEGRAGNRKWTDDAKAESALTELLADAAYKPRTIISPTDAQKAFKKAQVDFTVMAPLITQAPPSKSLVREENPKAPVAAGVEFPMQEAV